MPEKLQGTQPFLGILIITQQDKNIPFFVKPTGLVACSQKSITALYRKLLLVVIPKYPPKSQVLCNPYLHAGPLLFTETSSWIHAQPPSYSATTLRLSAIAYSAFAATVHIWRMYRYFTILLVTQTT